MNDPADVLDAAAEVIERDGWCQCQLNTIDGQVCLVGAIQRAVNEVNGETRSRNTERYWGAWPEGKAAVAAVATVLGCEPKDFNDTRGRTKFEVIDLLKSVAKDLRNEAKS